MPNVEFVKSALPKSIKGDKKVSAIEIEYKKTGEIVDIPVDGIFVAVGMIPNNQLVPDFVNTDDAGYVIADETGKTNAKGFFVAGDLRTKDLRQVLTAASDGACFAFSSAAPSMLPLLSMTIPMLAPSLSAPLCKVKSVISYCVSITEKSSFVNWSASSSLESFVPLILM